MPSCPVIGIEHTCGWNAAAQNHTTLSHNVGLMDKGGERLALFTYVFGQINTKVVVSSGWQAKDDGYLAVRLLVKMPKNRKGARRMTSGYHSMDTLERQVLMKQPGVGRISSGAPHIEKNFE